MPHLMKYSPLISINLSVNNSEISYTLATDIEAVYKGLVARGYVKVDGAKVSYDLPAV